MNLAFTTLEIRRLCENEAHADRVLGTKTAEGLRRRLADFVAAECVTEIVAGRPTEIPETNHMRMDLGGGGWLAFCSNHNSNPALTNGSPDWSKISRIKILKIEVNNE